MGSETNDKNKLNKQISVTDTICKGKLEITNDYCFLLIVQSLQIHKAATKAFNWMNQACKAMTKACKKLQKNISLSVKSFVLHKPSAEHVILQLLSLKDLHCIAKYSCAAKWIMFITRQRVWVYIFSPCRTSLTKWAFKGLYVSTASNQQYEDQMFMELFNVNVSYSVCIYIMHPCVPKS